MIIIAKETHNTVLFKYFTDIWDVKERHMNTNVPINYVFVLHVNNCKEPECIHPLCGGCSRSHVEKWFSNGLPLGLVPLPVPDPKYEWGRIFRTLST